MQAESDGGWVIVADETKFAVSEDMSGALVKLVPGGMRQLHWHTNLDEWQFVINGTIKVCPASPWKRITSLCEATICHVTEIAVQHKRSGEGGQEA